MFSYRAVNVRLVPLAGPDARFHRNSASVIEPCNVNGGYAFAGTIAERVAGKALLFGAQD